MSLTAGTPDLFHKLKTELGSKSVDKQNMDAKKQEIPKTHPLYSLIQLPIAGHFHRASSSLLAMLWSQQSRGHWAVHAVPRHWDPALQQHPLHLDLYYRGLALEMCQITFGELSKWKLDLLTLWGPAYIPG